ncbi:hypothetical protein AC790_22630 [Pantoea sp. RIT-PI-b]|uniref:hypothetical protein n=1 Tax=Pantoea sp. RIT-PI-b TaxID=1681195 RepID=UPI000675CB59|nr:hypothetical protein [Pantoea sp. RIT-PI-b]KNC05810.1 hypothetical protein AC790_22630 [Pantoea sp. RIT-PI-b]
MNIHSSTQAGTAPAAWLSGRFLPHIFAGDRPEKFKSTEWSTLDVRNHAWSEGGQLMQSLNQANGITSLHGLVVHGAACASLLALGSMAAVGRESSYELVMANVAYATPGGEFIGQWPTPVTPVEPQQPASETRKGDEQHNEIFMPVVEDVALSEPQSQQTVQEEVLVSHQVDNEMPKTVFEQLILTAEELPALEEAEKAVTANPIVHFSVEAVNAQQGALPESGISHDDRPSFKGQAAPGSLIELVNQHGEILGSSVVDQSGHWYIELHQPLDNGSYDFSFYTTGSDGVREMAGQNLHLIIAVAPVMVEPVIVESGLPIIDAPSFSVLPIIENEPVLNLDLIVAVEPVQVASDFAFGLSDLLLDSATELLFVESPDQTLATFDESALQMLIHPQGGITLWQEQEDLALMGIEYTPTAAALSTDAMLADLMAQYND